MIGGDFRDRRPVGGSKPKELCSKFQLPDQTSIAVSLGPKAQCFSRECDGSGGKASGAALGRCVGRVSQDEAWWPTVKAPHEPILCDDDQYLSFIVLCIDMAFQ